MEESKNSIEQRLIGEMNFKQVSFGQYTLDSNKPECLQGIATHSWPTRGLHLCLE
jgi:hypothetical protein